MCLPRSEPTRDPFLTDVSHTFSVQGTFSARCDQQSWGDGNLNLSRCSVRPERKRVPSSCSGDVPTDGGNDFLANPSGDALSSDYFAPRSIYWGAFARALPVSKYTRG